uniref:Uncharacterized protein n=1 Tax=Rhizophora mucronata TaxID=61149 RepID=A0A2P2JF76_RHIMU
MNSIFVRTTLCYVFVQKLHHDQTFITLSISLGREIIIFCIPTCRV